ncbi:hypothetical protein JXB31_01785 [Candidatus Woesearchaeota archaeon]|nr:hypothetical protein [Candidatus Woesearchaeota archaeon]
MHRKIGKRGVSLVDNWVEMFMVLLLILGLVISFLSDAAIVSYFIILICGFIVGRLYYLKRAKMRFPFYILVLGFLVGFIAGIELNSRGLIPLILLFFAVGCYLGYYVHEKRWLR